jgi:hypothetical protein
VDWDYLCDPGRAIKAEKDVKSGNLNFRPWIFVENNPGKNT